MSFTAKGQSNSHWCGTDQALEEYFQQNPSERAIYNAEVERFAKEMPSVQMNKSNHKLIIPVVFHVIHSNGQGNITKAQIDDAIRILNEDFNKQNPDTSIVRPVFSNLIADMEIEFRLARKDPNGNCTEGVTRTNSPSASNSPSNRNAPKSVIGWDPYSYLNIWVVNSISSGSGGGGNTLGFAQFPNTSQSANTYGIVIRADEVGTIGSASSADGRTLTHEVGHCFNLYHTFQGQCGTTCQFSGDYVCDTPPQFDDLNNSCSLSNSCSNDINGGTTSNPNPFTSDVPDQTENYMGYAIGCQALFTPGQKARVYAAFSSYSIMSAMTDSVNLVQTGTNDSYVPQACVPNVEINQVDKYACQGAQITFTDDSWGGPLTNYEWTFNGGTPSTSTQASPTIIYNAPGIYDVKLKISNAGGADSIVVSDFVYIGDTIGSYSGATYSEGFENAAGFANDWNIITTGNLDWARIAIGNASSNGIWLNNANLSNGEIRQIISPSIRLDNVSSPSLSFDVSFKRKSSNNTDELKLRYSTDCGDSWSNIISVPASLLAYDQTYTSGLFYPQSASQWKSYNIPANFLPSNFKNSKSVLLMFEFKNGGGNNLYIDNLNINGVLVGLNENKSSLENSFNFFPNPATNQLNVELNISKSTNQTEVYITNILGKRVKDVISKTALKPDQYKYNVDLSGLASGVYFVTMQTEMGRKTQKLVIK